MAKKSEPTNPFRFGPLALDEGFTNRSEEMRELLADVRNGQDVVILAPRRYGKSSLIWRVAQELVKDGVLVAQLDLMRTPTKDQLASKLAKAIHEELATHVDRVKDGLDVFRGLRLTPTVTIDPNDGSPSFSFEAQAAPEDIDATLEELFVRVGKIAADRKRRVALVLDEFQEVADIDKGLVKLMRSVFQQQPEVAHIYLGSKRHMMERIFNDENEPFWRSAKQMPLGVIAPDLFAPYAIDRFAVTGKELGADVCERALEITAGHPYVTQELLYFLWEGTGRGGRADAAALEAGLEGVIRSEHSHFSLIWDRASAAQRRVLQALAGEQPGRPASSDYRRRHSLPSQATVQSALRKLVRDEVVEQYARGQYGIAEPFLAQWIRAYES